MQKGNGDMPYARRISAADAVDAGYPGHQVVIDFTG
jgi:hypothetical protein